MTLPPDIEFREDIRLLIYRPRGLLNEASVNKIVNVIDNLEASLKEPFNRFFDTSGHDEVELNFRCVIQMSLHRVFSYGDRPPVKSAILATDSTIAHYCQLHAIITEDSPIKVRIFQERGKAAQWLDVSIEQLARNSPPAKNEIENKHPERAMKLAPEIEFHEDIRLLVYRPRGVIDEAAVRRIVSVLEELEAKLQAPFNRFSDTLKADEVELNFKYVIQVSLCRRLSYAGHPPVKSAILATDSTMIHYARLHALLTQGSPINVRVFQDRKEAADWLHVAVERLMQKA